MSTQTMSAQTFIDCNTKQQKGDIVTVNIGYYNRSQLLSTQEEKGNTLETLDALPEVLKKAAGEGTIKSLSANIVVHPLAYFKHIDCTRCSLTKVDETKPILVLMKLEYYLADVHNNNPPIDRCDIFKEMHSHFKKEFEVYDAESVDTINGHM